MKNNDWRDLGEQIKDVVDSAVFSGDFQNLSRSIGDIVNTTIDTVKSNVKDNIYSSASHRQNPSGSGQQTSAQETDTAVTLYTKHPPGKTAGILLTVLGFVLMGICAILFILFLIFSLVIHPLTVLTVISAVFTAAGLILGINGIRKLGFINRFRKYVRQLNGRIYVPIQTLAEKTGKTLNFTMRDLQKMIHQRFFYQGHLDKEGCYLILSDQAYEEYQTAKAAYASKQKEEIRQQESEKLSGECRKLIDDGQAYINHIRTCSGSIPDIGFSEKLGKMVQVISRIFDEVRRHPEVAPDLQKMMDYYLPTTKKLLDAYCDLDAQPIEGEHISSTKKEIEAAIDTLNTAFEKLLDSLFADRAWDISSDISVLNTVLAQEGLTDSDFKQP